MVSTTRPTASFIFQREMHIVVSFLTISSLTIPESFPCLFHSSLDLSKSECEKFAEGISSLKDLPASCEKYSSVVDKVKSKEKPAIDPFAGMAGGQAVSARAAMAGGRGE